MLKPLSLAPVEATPLSESELSAFIYEGNSRGFAAGEPYEEAKGSTNTLRREYRIGTLLYVDEFSGLDPASGATTIYSNGEVIWQAHYYGKADQNTDCSLDEIIDFLRQALRQPHPETSFRGPAMYMDGDWQYFYTQKGDLNDLRGEEVISHNGISVFHQSIMGGKIAGTMVENKPDNFAKFTELLHKLENARNTAAEAINNMPDGQGNPLDILDLMEPLSSERIVTDPTTDSSSKDTKYFIYDQLDRLGWPAAWRNIQQSLLANIDSMVDYNDQRRETHSRLEREIADYERQLVDIGEDGGESQEIEKLTDAILDARQELGELIRKTFQKLASPFEDHLNEATQLSQNEFYQTEARQLADAIIRVLGIEDSNIEQ